MQRVDSADALSSECLAKIDAVAYPALESGHVIVVAHDQVTVGVCPVDTIRNVVEPTVADGTQEQRNVLEWLSLPPPEDLSVWVLIIRPGGRLQLNVWLAPIELAMARAVARTGHVGTA